MLQGVRRQMKLDKTRWMQMSVGDLEHHAISSAKMTRQRPPREVMKNIDRESS